MSEGSDVGGSIDDQNFRLDKPLFAVNTAGSTLGRGEESQKEKPSPRFKTPAVRSWPSPTSGPSELPPHVGNPKPT